MTATLTELPPTDTMPDDETPPRIFDAACRTCGIELPYSGKGRRPKFCAEHRLAGERRHPKVPRTTRKAPTGQNAQLATSATEALVQLNGLISMGLMLTRMPQTAIAMSEAEEGFRESTMAALLTDPDLCRTILRAGSTGGKVALGISYAMLGAAVAPVGVLEFRANRAQSAGESVDEDRTEVPSPAL